jgi:nucleoid-associated protein YgaU
VSVPSSWDELSRWYEAVGPAVAAVALLQVIALALAGWLIVATALQVLSALLPTLGRARSLADLISPRSLQRLGHGLAGLSLTAGLAAPAPGAGTPSVPLVAASPSPGHGHVEGEEPGAATATMRLVEDASSAPAPSQTPAASAAVIVEAGDSFWSIAVSELTDLEGVPPSDRQVAPYWRRLIEANRSRLVDPGNPDLLYPGQELVLPVL